MVGHFDKMVMTKGEAAMRAEFNASPRLSGREDLCRASTTRPAGGIAGAVSRLSATVDEYVRTWSIAKGVQSGLPQ